MLWWLFPIFGDIRMMDGLRWVGISFINFFYDFGVISLSMGKSLSFFGAFVAQLVCFDTSSLSLPISVCPAFLSHLNTTFPTSSMTSALWTAICFVYANIGIEIGFDFRLGSPRKIKRFRFECQLSIEI